jgi:hypothetical protein
MKRIGLLMLTLLGFSCQKAENIEISSICPEKPVSQLRAENVKKIDLTETLVTESGQLSQGTMLGYSFLGRVNQKLVYETSQDICLWLFTPDNQLLLSNTTELPSDGQYTLQIASRQGSQSFDLELALSNLEDSSTSSTLQKPISPEQSIENYYKNINDRNYDQSWQSLTSSFKNPSGSPNEIPYQDYQDWWNKVDYVQINGIELLEQTENEAILKVNLQYQMKAGNLVQDKKNIFYLIWDEDKSNWLINKKIAP